MEVAAQSEESKPRDVDQDFVATARAMGRNKVFRLLRRTRYRISELKRFAKNEFGTQRALWPDNIKEEYARLKKDARTLQMVIEKRS